MTAKIAGMLAAIALLLALADAPTAQAAWSLTNPFASKDKPASKPKTYTVNSQTKQPSALERIGTGIKDFFHKTGEAVGLAKPKPQKPNYAYSRPVHLQQPKKESKPWFPWLAPAKPDNPATVSDWMKNKRLDP